MLKKLFICIAALIAGASIAVAQGYRINLKLDDAAKDSTVILAVYVGEGKYARDTAKTDKNGLAVFSKKDTLPGGLYMFVTGNTLLFDFLVSDRKSQSFSAHYKKNKDKSVEVVYKDSPENVAFVEFQKYMGARQAAARRLREKAQADTTFAKTAKDSLEIISNEEKAYTTKVAAQWSGKLLGSLSRALQAPPQMPELNLPKDMPKRDSIMWVHYYQWEKNHFFDNFNFSDARLLNTPMFQPNFDYYFKNKIIQQPDSLISAIHMVLKKSQANRDMFMYCLGHLYNMYIQWNTVSITPDHAMGMEAVVIDLMKNYYLSGVADWAQKDTTFMKQVRDYVFYNSNSLVGMKAHDLKMETMAGQYISLYDVQAPYTLLLFFDTDCGHCKTEIPKIYDVYKKYRDKGFQVYCVYTQVNGPNWQKFVEENHLDWINVWDPYHRTGYHDLYGVTTTPQAFLINRDKTIIARRVSHDLLDQLLDFYINKKPIGGNTAEQQTNE